jgi:hypothetical protein
VRRLNRNHSQHIARWEDEQGEEFVPHKTVYSHKLKGYTRQSPLPSQISKPNHKFTSKRDATNARKMDIPWNTARPENRFAHIAQDNMYMKAVQWKLKTVTKIILTVAMYTLLPTWTASAMLNQNLPLKWGQQAALHKKGLNENQTKTASTHKNSTELNNNIPPQSSLLPLFKLQQLGWVL